MTEGSDRTVGLAQAHDMIILPSDRNRRPRRLLIECQPPISREFQAGSSVLATAARQRNSRPGSSAPVFGRNAVNELTSVSAAQQLTCKFASYSDPQRGFSPPNVALRWFLMRDRALATAYSGPNLPGGRAQTWKPYATTRRSVSCRSLGGPPPDIGATTRCTSSACVSC